MTTVNELITDSLRDLGAIGINEVPSAAESSDALRALNQMLGTWQNETLMVYSRRQEVFTLPTGQQSYTIGTGGDINTTRPVRIDAAYMRDPNDNDLDIYVCRSFQDYSDIITKNALTTLITAIYYDPTFGASGLGTVYVWPVLNSNTYRLVLWMWTTLSEYASINETINLPPGYERALRTNLAIELGPRYGRDITPALAKMAMDSKNQLKKVNMDIPTLTFDQGLGGSGITFNYLTGQPT